MGAFVNPEPRAPSAAPGMDVSAAQHCPVNPVLTREQFAAAYGAGYAKTTRFLISRGIAPEIAEESAQAAWVKGWEHRGRLRKPDRVLSWVNTIAMNVYRNRLRRREHGDPLPEIPVLPHGGAREIDLRRALARCAPVDREVIESHYVSGYTSAELALDRGCTAGAIRIRLLRARRRIRERLE